MPLNSYYGASVADLANRDSRRSMTCYAPRTTLLWESRTDASQGVAVAGS